MQPHLPPLEPASPSMPRVGQPAVARRAARLLALLRVGLFLAVAGVASSLAMSGTLLDLGGSPRIWPGVCSVTAMTVLVACAVQLVAWHRAQLEWTGRRDVALLGLMGPSRAAQVLGTAAALLGPWAALQVFRTTGEREDAHWWALASAVCQVLAVAAGAIHRLDPAGPGGVLPARVAVMHATRR